MKNPFLVGEKVYLRPLEPEDAPVIQRFINDPAISRNLQAYRPYTLAMELAYIGQAAQSPTDLSLGVCPRHDDRLVGTVSLHAIHPKDRRAELGIAIGEQSEWGKGFGTDATRLVTAHAFDTLNLNRVALTVYAFNERGIHVYEKLGFQREGVLRQYTFADGRYHDALVMSVIREHWEARALP